MKPGVFYVLTEELLAFRNLATGGSDELEMGDMILTVCESPKRKEEIGCLTRFGFRWIVKNDIVPTF